MSEFYWYKYKWYFEVQLFKILSVLITDNNLSYPLLLERQILAQGSVEFERHKFASQFDWPPIIPAGISLYCCGQRLLTCTGQEPLHNKWL